ncbi:MAG: O-antigen ligase family protein [Bacteroidales bacterium]|nr:O-antigen ligase family protein [Bacteroidales bacterium]
MHLRFSAVILIFATILAGTIYALHLQGLVTAANEVYARYTAIGLFLASFLILVWQKIKNHRFSWGDFYKNHSLIIVGLTVLLVSLFFRRYFTYYTSTLFIVASLIFFLHSRKFYAPPKFFYFIIAYALLMFFGTIGTTRGFYFPDHTLRFYLLPLAFCFFNLSQKTLLRIGEIFFKAGIIFLSITVLYWFYNFLHLDADFIKWITGKTGYYAEMVGWKEQAKYSMQGAYCLKNWAEHTWFSAYFFASTWSHFHHPTANSIVILGVLITGFYLYYQKIITKWELLLYVILALFVIQLLQSRFGLTGFVLLVSFSGLYYLRMRTKYFNIGLITYILLGGASLLVFGSKVFGFIYDGPRNDLRTVAMAYIRDNFWWGSGYREGPQAMLQQAEKMQDVHLPIATHAHNQFLDDTIQFGILGLIVLVAMLAAIVCYAIKNRSYLLQMWLCVMLLFMWIEAGMFFTILTFILFFTAITEAERRERLNDKNLKM